MLAGRQDRMLREAAADWRIAVKALAAMGAKELLARRTELARQAIRKGLAGVRELAETSTRSQAAALSGSHAEHECGRPRKNRRPR